MLLGDNSVITQSYYSYCPMAFSDIPHYHVKNFQLHIVHTYTQIRIYIYIYIYIYICIYIYIYVCIYTVVWKQVDILISKNQALQILYLKHHIYNETT